MHSPSLGARAFIPALLAGAVLIGLAPVTPAAAATPTTEAQQIIQIAKAQVGDPWRYGATGPYAFDCSGLVIYAFKAAGDGAAIGNGNYRSARSLYDWFRARGLASRTNPKPGDLVVWGSGSHIGIYIGSGMAVSTLTSGVRVHGVFAVTASFTAYLHTGMSTKLISGATVTATSTLTVAPVITATRVVIDATNLRTGHSTGATALALLPVGRSVGVIRTWKDAYARTWLYVTTGGRLGWVAGWKTRAT
ncbi:MAG TPA: NlpC/P60 family protein [Patescibacteria group bacterium]|nr:NlpC/P60 family protein [Patescibacteria group bacterium]